MVLITDWMLKNALNFIFMKNKKHELENTLVNLKDLRKS